jgi:hypothetical protein
LCYWIGCKNKTWFINLGKPLESLPE